ncbi:MAG: hypothetical protein RLZZ396_2983 [Planctomycetota bacterium]|jgi:RNA polymerase sigma-70 factor (ECF subfamily)
MADFPPPKHSLTTTSSLVADLKSLSPERWEALVLLYSPTLRYWLYLEKVPQAAMEDLLQESLRSIYSGIGNFERTKENGSFRGWMRTIIRRRVVDYRRRNAEKLPTQAHLLNELKAPSEIEESQEDQEQTNREIIARAFELVRQRVNPQTWQMFEMSVLESLPTQEIASTLGVTQANVRMAKARVAKLLRELLVDFQ